MRLILMGAPGAGKGTQAVVLAEKFGVPHISTGDIFRNNIKSGTELGRKAKEYIDKGALVPDEVTIEIVKDRLQQSDCGNGFILDGFPRTIPQASYLKQALGSMGITLDYAVNIHVPDEEIIKRLSGRRVCPNCGMSYHTYYGPPKLEGACDSCSTPLIQRDDDKEETVIKRLSTYHDQTEPLIGYYKNEGKLLVIEGRKRVDEVTDEVLKALGVNK